MPNNNSAAHLDQFDQIQSAMGTFGKYLLPYLRNFSCFFSVILYFFIIFWSCKKFIFIVQIYFFGIIN